MEVRTMTTEDRATTSTFPSSYNPKMGLKAGRVTELRIFFHVKPGHAEQLKEACRKFAGGGARTNIENALRVGIHDQSITLFDNDTRLLFATTFDTDWDPYIEDSVNLVGKENYFGWLQHLEEVPEYPMDNLPSTDEMKVFLNANRVTATTFIRSFPNVTVRQQYKMMQLQKAFEQVLDDPDAAQALEHPALKPLLEQAAD
jgi:hypothetical protein